MKYIWKTLSATIIIVGLAICIFLVARENMLLRTNNKFLTEQNQKLTASLQEALKIKHFSIALAPTINNKVNSAFGSTKNVTLQYYFQMDGNTLEIMPDSIFTISKEYKQP